MQCELMYHMHFGLSDIENCDLTELKYIHGWLVHQKQEEADIIEGIKKKVN